MKPTRERAIAALRAVLDECTATTLQFRPSDPNAASFPVVNADRIRQAIETALAADPTTNTLPRS